MLSASSKGRLRRQSSSVRSGEVQGPLRSSGPRSAKWRAAPGPGPTRRRRGSVTSGSDGTSLTAHPCCSAADRHERAPFSRCATATASSSDDQRVPSARQHDDLTAGDRTLDVRPAGAGDQPAAGGHATEPRQQVDDGGDGHRSIIGREPAGRTRFSTGPCAADSLSPGRPAGSRSRWRAAPRAARPAPSRRRRRPPGRRRPSCRDGSAGRRAGRPARPAPRDRSPAP